MKEKCVFSEIKEDGKRVCTFPNKKIKICFLCNKYVENTGDILDKMPFVNFATQRINNRKSFYISVLALLFSVIALLINFLKLIN